jgi:hypothetical protein
MNLQINIAQMRKKTEIETKLLEQINFDLGCCVTDLKNIYQTHKLNPIVLDNDKSNLDKSKLYDITKILEINNIDNQNQTKLSEKLFAHIEQTYYAFQYFYLKKRDFMGMNLTGLIDGKMETGLGFRNCLDKLSNNTIETKYPELFNMIEANNYEFNVWKIKSDTFGWGEYGLEIFKNVIVISNPTENIFYLLVEKK